MIDIHDRETDSYYMQGNYKQSTAIIGPVYCCANVLRAQRLRRSSSGTRPSLFINVHTAMRSRTLLFILLLA